MKIVLLEIQKILRKLAILLTSVAAIFSGYVLAADEASEKRKEGTPISIYGYIDGSYNYLVSSNQFTNGNFNRVLDIEEHGFTLQQAAIIASMLPEEGLGGIINFNLGRDAFAIASYGYNPDIGIKHVGLDLTSAYLQYAHGPFRVMAGKFVAIVGVEVIDPTSDTNFSRGLLFANTSDTHTGMRATYTANSAWKFIAGINNGWDNIRDPGRDKTIELGVTYTPCARLSLSAQGYSGEERVISHTSTGPTGRRNLIDLIASYNLTDKLTLALNYDYGTQGNALNNNTDTATWQGLAAYLNYKFNDIWRISLRGEDFDDTDGYRTGIVQNLKEGTITIGFAPIKNLEFRAETRRDFSNVASFLSHDYLAPRKTQQSYALEAVYKFSNISSH